MTNDPAAQDPQAPEPSQEQPPAAPATPAAPQRPAYGELAPEGWSWKPEGDTEPGAQAGSASTAPVGAAANAGAALPLAGVPHNLGAGGASNAGSAPANAPAPSDAGPGAQSQDRSDSGSGTSGNPTPYRADAPTPSYAKQPGAKSPRLVDRIFTIGLLVLGGFTTLSISSSFFALESQLRLTGSMIGIDSPQLASWVGPLGTISGIAVLALFAFTLILSIRRMRAGNLTFWVPLSAGVIAVLFVLVVPTVAMLAGAPEIMKQLEADPMGSMDLMLEYAKTLEQP